MTDFENEKRPEKKKRQKSRRELEEQLRKAREREVAIKKELAKKKRQERREAKKWEDNAKIQIGGIVLKHLGLDWRTIDQDAFERDFAMIAKQVYTGSQRPVFDCRQEKATASDAHVAWMDFQSRKQHEASEERKARVATASGSKSDGE